MAEAAAKASREKAAERRGTWAYSLQAESAQALSLKPYLQGIC